MNDGVWVCVTERWIARSTVKLDLQEGTQTDRQTTSFIDNSIEAGILLGGNGASTAPFRSKTPKSFYSFVIEIAITTNVGHLRARGRPCSTPWWSLSLARARFLTQYDQVVEILPYSLHLPCHVCLSTLTLPLLSQCSRSGKLCLAVEWWYRATPSASGPPASVNRGVLILSK